MNKWKVAFVVLAGGNITLLLFLMIWATSPIEDEEVTTMEMEQVEQSEGSVLLVETTASDFEKVALKYISKELETTSLPFQIRVENSIHISSELFLFGVTVPISMDFDPIVDEYGNIRLKQTIVNVGKFNIPPTTALKLMRDTITYPDWVTIRPEEQEIYVDLSQLQIFEGSILRAKEIDLQNDRVLLEIMVQ